ncbi:hypothetical protein [Streptomyces iranensis]|uniref:hypothetical protein n=1 Tax=Streptomyces iranensis TaxID=576784 RepID=UPI0039B77148
MDDLARFVSELGLVERVDALPFHKLGAPKHQALDVRFPLREIRYLPRSDRARPRILQEAWSQGFLLISE